MAATRTLAQLRTSVRQKGNYNRSNVFTDTLLTEWLNAAIKSVYNQLLENFGDNYYTTESTLNSSIGSDSVSLPADFLKLVAFEHFVGGDYVPVPRINVRDRSRYQSSVWVAHHASEYAYFLMGSNIKFARTATAGDTFRLTYIPTFTDLSADGDTFDGVNGYEELVIQKVLYDCARREKSSTTEVERRIAGLTKEVELRAQDRDVGEPLLLVDHTVGGYFY